MKFVTCVIKALKREIIDLGYDIERVEDGRITFLGDAEALCRANVFLRTAERVMILGELPPEDFNRKYESRKGHLGHADTYHIAKAVEYELLFYEWERLEAAA